MASVGLSPRWRKSWYLKSSQLVPTQSLCSVKAEPRHDTRSGSVPGNNPGSSLCGKDHVFVTQQLVHTNRFFRTRAHLSPRCGQGGVASAFVPLVSDSTSHI